MSARMSLKFHMEHQDLRNALSATQATYTAQWMICAVKVVEKVFVAEATPEVKEEETARSKSILTKQQKELQLLKKIWLYGHSSCSMMWE